ncbi:division plane positioning ATPase MipZ [Pantoea stewartii]|uniref:ATPase n=1 Tax=Pantoea stewartii subsp. stewartii DC283 TaxID=660596 RepID=A0ABN4ZE26_PANSE|nr:division plane positioning ATPase MipZ [Pantoea stewartii]ARF52076.1 ATPase [Pantoea stewartii subsp. stewartii DC283]
MPIYAISHHKGGAGKTTSTVHIVGELKPDITIDLDIHEGVSVINQLRPDDKKWNVLAINNKEKLIAVLRELDDQGKTVVIDCGGFDADINRVAVAVADVVIVPANDTVTEQIGLAKFDKVLAEISKQMDVELNAKIMFCKTEPNQKHFPDMEDTLKKVKHMSLLNSRLSYRRGRYGFTQSLRQGMGITEIKHGRASAAGKEVVALVKELRKLVENGK